MDVAELERQVEHKFAPVPLIAVQAFANTFDFESDQERLADVDAARRWLVDSGLAVTGVRVGEAELTKLLGARRVIRGLLEANLTGRVRQADARGLEQLATAYRVSFDSDRTGQLALHLDPAPKVEAFIAQLLGIIFQAQLKDEWPRLKICASDDCRWAFYDASKNRGGTWCQMEVCGNRVKNRRYRRRLRDANRA